LKFIDLNLTYDFTDIYMQVAPLGLIFLFMVNLYKQIVPDGT